MSWFDDLTKSISATTSKIGEISGTISGITEQVSGVSQIISGSVSQVSSIFHRKKIEPMVPEQRSRACFIATEVFGEEGHVPEKFYAHRDRMSPGLVKMYYRISPKIVPIIQRHNLHEPVRKVLNFLVKD